MEKGQKDKLEENRGEYLPTNFFYIQRKMIKILNYFLCSYSLALNRHLYRVTKTILPSCLRVIYKKCFRKVVN